MMVAYVVVLIARLKVFRNPFVLLHVLTDIFPFITLK